MDERGSSQQISFSALDTLHPVKVAHNGSDCSDTQLVWPAMVIGAGIYPSAPGVQNPSMAAMTVSMDKLGTRYATVCQTNGYRVEMIQTDTIMTELKPMVQP